MLSRLKCRALLVAGPGAENRGEMEGRPESYDLLVYTILHRSSIGYNSLHKTSMTSWPRYLLA
jgi:hypothetical protein